MATRADNIASNLSLANFSKATELKNRIWFTIGALIVFRFLSFVPLPGVNPLVLESLYDQARGGILDMFNMFSGGSLERMSLIALGVMPYITASIVVQMASSLHPALAAMKKEGIVVYTVGLQVSSSSLKTALTNCATSSQYAYFPKAPAELVDVFQQIGRAINEVRLVH